MIIRRSEERGLADHGWLLARHTFSFADYFDRRHMHFRSLRVINEDRVQPGKGFGTHPHKNMEIFTYILEGELTHRDSMGHAQVIRPGDVQYMSAGKGVLHSEFNSSQTELVHLLQIWILPEQEDTEPRYDQRNYPEALRLNSLCPILNPEGRDGAMKIGQDARVFASVLRDNHVLEYSADAGRGLWIQVAKGTLEVNGQTLNAGDATSLENERAEMRAPLSAEFMLFDLK